MKSLKIGSTLIFILMCFSCSTSPVRHETKTAPGWTHWASRSIVNSNITYVGIGEDRSQENARTKSEAIALQDLANECSLIPKTAHIQPDYFVEKVGILYRSFSRVTIDSSDCLKARSAISLKQLRAQSDVIRATQVSEYQRFYDPPEPAESAPLVKLNKNLTVTQFFVVRQQVALAKQKSLLLSKNIVRSDYLAAANQKIAAFENENSTIMSGTYAFSVNRPNAFNHQAANVRETVTDRERIQGAYPAITTSSPPSKGSGTKRKGKGRAGRSSGRHVPQDQQQPFSQTPAQNNQ